MVTTLLGVMGLEYGQKPWSYASLLLPILTLEPRPSLHSLFQHESVTCGFPRMAEQSLEVG